MEKFTRENAYEYIYDMIKEGDLDSYGEHLIDKIYNQHEIELEQAFHKGVENGNESMKVKMEEEFKQRTCENCKHWQPNKVSPSKGYCGTIGVHNIGGCGDYFEEKEK